MKKLMFRQGDVMIFAVEPDVFATEVTSLETPKLEPELTLAHGERTGHRHRIKRNRNDKVYRRGDDHFVALRSKRTLVHEEHAPIELPPGNYLFEIQRQYEPGAIRNVAD